LAVLSILYFNIINYAFLINILSAIIFILIGGILPLYERKKLSLIQRRVGPKFVGLDGRLQFIVDAIKIFLKEYIFIFFTNKYYFLLLPIITLIVNLFFLINFQWNNNVFFYDIELNILYLTTLTSISNILIFLSGYVCKNKYTLITSNRTIVVFFINELVLNIIVLILVWFSKSYSLSNYIVFKNFEFGITWWLVLLPILIYFILIEINKVPFDFQEAESELIMGYTNEYVGFLFGVYVLIEYLHIFIYSYLFFVLIM